MNLRTIMIAMLLVLAAATLFSATTQTIAIIDFEPEERSARTITGQMLHARRGDFVSTFGDYPQYELMSLGDGRDALKAQGLSSVSNLSRQDASEIGNRLEADIVLWGTVSDASSTEIRMIANVLNVRSGSISQLRFNLPKKSADRRNALKTQLIDNIAEIAGGELIRLFEIGEQQLSTQNYNSAYDTFSRVVEIDPENLEAFFYLGYIQFLLNDFSQSVYYYERALELDPEDERILNNIAESLRRDGRYEDAIAYLRQLAELSPDELIWFRIANLYLDMSLPYEAMEALNEALELNPEYERAHYRLGVLLFDNEFIPESIEHLEFVAERDPEDDLINRKLTAAYMRTGQLDQAIVNYQNQIERNPDNTTAYLNLAGAYRTLERNEEALQALNKLLEIDQQNPTVYIRMADVLISLGRLDDAERRANAAMNLDPDLYEPYMLLSQIAQIRGYSRYETFIDVDERAREAYGSEANRLISQRDSARNDANNFFTASKNHLETAQTKTNEASIIRDINARKQVLNQLIEETKPTFFD
jgi:tetratricopeptide (TPR) repeat protein